MVQVSKVGRIQTVHDTAGTAEMRVAWLQTVEKLTWQVHDWAILHKWNIDDLGTKEICEEPLGTYSVPRIQVRPPKGIIVLEPVARNVLGSDGCVDLYAYPTMYRVRLLYSESDQNWTVRTDSGINWPHPWNEETFVELVNGLVRA